MRLSHLEAFAVRIPLIQPVKMARETVTHGESLFIRIETERGVEGWGEAAAAPTMTGETLPGMLAVADMLANALRGSSFEHPQELTQIMEELIFGNKGAKAAIEIAFADALGQTMERPSWALFGEQVRDMVPLIGVVGTGSTDGDLIQANRYCESGYSLLKIKVGSHSPEDDAARSIAICEIVAGRARISVDADQGFSAEQATKFLSCTANTPIAYFEQPVPGDDYESMAKVVSATSIVIGADEGIHSIDDLHRHFERKAASGASLKTIKLGGIGGIVFAGAACNELAFTINVACKTGETGVACAAALQAAAVLPSVDWGFGMTNSALVKDVLSAPLVIEKGNASIPNSHGLGITVDVETLKSFRVNPDELSPKFCLG